MADERRAIVEEYLKTQNYCETARRKGVAIATVRRIVKVHFDNKQAEEARRFEGMARDAILKYLAAMTREDMIKKASLSQVTSAISMLTDKFMHVGKVKEDKAGAGKDDIAQAIEQAWEALGDDK